MACVSLSQCLRVNGEDVGAKLPLVKAWPVGAPLLLAQCATLPGRVLARTIPHANVPGTRSALRHG